MNFEQQVRALKSRAWEAEDWDLVEDCRIVLGEVQIVLPSIRRRALERVKEAL